PGHNSLLVGGGRVTNTYHYAVVSAVPGEGKVLVGLGSHGDVLDVSLGGFLIPLELLDGGLGNVLLGLGSFVDHIQVGALKVDAQDLGALVALFHYIGHIGHGSGEDLLTLG